MSSFIPTGRQPLISVIMSVYNEHEIWLKEAVNSILNQTFKDFEFIIINDNPQREINNRILQYFSEQDSRVIIVQNEENIGLTKSLNKGIELARGKFIARMDADDIAYSCRFEKQLNFMQKHPEIGVCGSNILLFGNQNKVQIYPRDNKDCFVFQRSPFAHSAVMIRTDILKKNNLSYNPEFRYAQDYELWSRIYGLTEFYNLQEVLLKYRVTDKQVTKRNYKEQQSYAAHIRRTAFLSFCKHKHLVYQFSDNLSIDDIINLKKRVLPFLTSSQDQKAVKTFIYYMYRSISQTSVFYSLMYWIFSGDFFKMSLSHGIKVLVYNLFRKKVITIL